MKVHQGPAGRYYVVDSRTGAVMAGPFDTRSAAEDESDFWTHMLRSPHHISVPS